MESPSEIILKRFDAFIKNLPEIIYGCYSPNSDFIKFFPNKSNYLNFFEQLKKETLPIKIDIVKVTIKNTLAQVTYIESFLHIDEGQIDYFSRTTLVKTDNGWQILKEKREKINRSSQQFSEDR